MHHNSLHCPANYKMITKALQYTCDALDQFLRNRLSLDEKKVLLNNVVDSNGSIPPANQNMLVISLINIEKETSRPYYHIRNQKMANGNFSDINPPERYNLDILVSSSFDDYGESLKFLDTAILFFQMNILLDPTSFSNIPDGLNKLHFDNEKITYHQMHSLWTAMGAKYQPSVIYKMRLVTFQGDEPSGFSTAISNISNQAQA